MNEQYREVDPLDINRPLGIDEKYWSATFLSLSVVLIALTSIQAGFSTLILGIIAASFYVDALSYIIHLLLDNFEFKKIPTLKRMAFEFQVHHNRPGDVTIRGPLRNNSFELFLYVGLPHILLGFFFPVTDFLRLFFQLSGFFITAVPAVHMYAHLPNHNNLPISFLQKAGILLSQSNHSKHHIGEGCEYRDYALLNGWTNNILNSFLAGPRFKKKLKS